MPGNPSHSWIGLTAIGRCARAAETADSNATVNQAKGFWRMMVCSRSGPVEMMVMGTPTSACSRSRYLRAFTGRSS